MKRKRLLYTGAILIFLALFLYRTIKKIWGEEDESRINSACMPDRIEEKGLNSPDKMYTALNEETKDGLSACNDWSVRI